MLKEHFRQVIRLASLGFIPGVASLMVSVGVVLPISLSRNHFGILKDISWEMLLIQITVQALGFVLTAMCLTPKRLSPTKWRAFLAGIVSVFIAGVTSVFSQGAGLPVYLITPLIAGIVATLSISYQFTRHSIRPESEAYRS